MQDEFVFISESVTEGHPDKVCDQISDAIVDRFLQQDPYAHVIVECAASTSILFVAARFDAQASIDFPAVARTVIERIGYDQPSFNGKTCSIVTSLKEVPANGYGRFEDKTLSEADLDRMTVKNQATVFGFACTQTPAYMPLPIWLAHQLARRLAMVRRSGLLPYLTPDGKTQVGIVYRQGRPYRIHSLTVIASQHRAPTSGGPTLQRLQDDIRALVIAPVFQHEPLQPEPHTHVFINPDGAFIGGGPSAHAGLTGRKNAVDTYGEYSRHSGAALSGKDPTRIDRVGAYAARYAAKNVVVAGLAEACEVQLSYSIGQARPVSVQVHTFGTGTLPDATLTTLVTQHFDFRLASIIQQFQLRFLPRRQPEGFYLQLAAYGHMGRLDLEVPWEVTDKAHLLREYHGTHDAFASA